MTERIKEQITDRINSLEARVKLEISYCKYFEAAECQATAAGLRVALAIIESAEGPRPRAHKSFMYFQTTDGGMENFPVRSAKDLSDMIGWMDENCRLSDQQLLRWMEKADVGEMTVHRLGCLVRLKDEA